MLTLFMMGIAYLIGSISSAVVVCRALKLPDPRTTGSKNAGATNVARMTDKKYALLVLISDMLKGFIAVLLAKMFGIHGLGLALVALAAVAGHIYPVFFKFKGGKGVATAMGAILGLSLFLAIIVGIVWIVVAMIYQYSSLASLSALGAALLLSLLFYPGYFIPLLAMVALIGWHHQENIERLRKGKESKLKW